LGLINIGTLVHSESLIASVWLQARSASHTGGSKLDPSGSKLDHSGFRIDPGGSKLDTSGCRIYPGGSKLDRSGSELDQSGFRIDPSGCKLPLKITQLHSYTVKRLVLKFEILKTNSC
jgi:hypothetical protein